MKSTKTRILSLLLVACMLLSVMVPAVFAAEGDQLDYSFVTADTIQITAGDSGTAGKFDGDTAFVNALKTDANASVANWEYLARSINSGVAIMAHKTHGMKFQVRNGAAEADPSAWFAIKLKNVPAAKYDMVFTAPNKAAQKADVYVMPASVFANSAAYAVYLGEADKDPLQHYGFSGTGVAQFPADGEKKITALMDELLATNAVTNVGVYEAPQNSTQTITGVTFAGDANNEYVMIVKPRDIDGEKSTVDLWLKSLTLNWAGDVAADTVEAKIGEQTFATVELALEEAAKNGGTVDLQAAAEAETIEVKAGVTLNLNGQTLTATNVKCFEGGIVTDSQDGVGRIKSGNVELKTDNAHLIINDARTETAGYGVYAASVSTVAAKAEGAGVKFKFTLNANADAYAAIAASGLEVTGKLVANGTPVDGTLVFDNTEVVKPWAANGSALYGMYVTVTGLEGVTSLEMTPSIGNLTGAAITYTAQ